MIMTTEDGDLHALTSDIKYGKYAILKWFMVKGDSVGNATHYTPSDVVLSVASGGYPYSEIWSARAFGIVNHGLGEPKEGNHYTHCAIMNLQNGKIEWRNYEA